MRDEDLPMKPDLITPDLIVADLLDSWPQAIPVFIKHKMSCVGCSMSCFETLSDAARIYGIAPAVLMAELQQTIQAEREE
jgi:hybrid cluster-associated redox disulfide protein